jgi:hypothetical protein
LEAVPIAGLGTQIYSQYIEKLLGLFTLTPLCSCILVQFPI